MDTLVDIRGLKKHFGPIAAVDGVSLTVKRGEVMGFLGPNGAGKTTTMRMITGYLPPDEGTAIVVGHDVTRQPIQVKRKIGYLPEGAPLYGDMTPASFLAFVAEARELRGADKDSRLDHVRDLLHLGSVWLQPIETLSKGFKRRVGLAQAILHEPDVIVLDEPASGLDPIQALRLRELIRTLAADHTVVLSTHVLSDVVASCDRVAIVHEGRLRHVAVLAELESGKTLRVRIGRDVDVADWTSIDAVVAAEPMAPRCWR
ncbi:MAG: ABC transporter ATP-binding protein, partial [Rhodospirillales bacterium]|nr:ABC transporter ATP-binding protein [Rhodospirillales bacterium]